MIQAASQLIFDFSVFVPPPETSVLRYKGEDLKYLTGPIVHHPSTWSAELPGIYLESVPAARLEVLESGDSDLACSELECFIYMFGYMMAGPSTDEYFKVYMYLTKRICEKYQKRKWPLKESQDVLGTWEMQILRDLAGDIRRGVIKNAKRKDLST